MTSKQRSCKSQEGRENNTPKMHSEFQTNGVAKGGPAWARTLPKKFRLQ